MHAPLKGSGKLLTQKLTTIFKRHAEVQKEGCPLSENLNSLECETSDKGTTASSEFKKMPTMKQLIVPRGYGNIQVLSFALTYDEHAIPDSV